MKFHGFDPHPQPFPLNGEGSEGTSLAVAQWVALLRGEWPVRTPANAFRVESVHAVDMYCLTCLDVRRFDVIRGKTRVVGALCVVVICRCCGKEVRYG